MKKIAVMGHVDHGKTTLVSAISFIFGTERINCSENPLEILRTETKINFGGEEYLFFDYPDDESYEENLTGSEEGAVLVVAAIDGPMSGTRKAVELCEKLGIRKITAFLNSCDLVADDDLVDFIEYDVEDLLAEHGFDGCGFIRGSAKKAIDGYPGWKEKIIDLVKAVAE